MVQFPAGLIDTHTDDVRGPVQHVRTALRLEAIGTLASSCLIQIKHHHGRIILSLTKDQMPAERLAAEPGTISHVFGR
jgi:hypothetical protein